MKTLIIFRVILGFLITSLHFTGIGAESWEYLMDFQKPKNAAEQAAWDLLKTCRHQGDEGARRLIAEMPRMPDKFHSQALQVLLLTGSTNAQEYFLSLALTGTSQAVQTRGANLFVDATKDASAARNLLASDSREVRIIGIRAMSVGKDFQLSHAIWNDVQHLLASDSLRDRQLGAILVGRDTGGDVSPKQKVQGLLQSLAGLEDLAGADKLVGFRPPGFQCREADIATLAFIDALKSMRGVEMEFWRSNTPAQPGPVRDSLLMVRFFKGDATANEEVRRIVREHPSAPLRWKALAVYDQVGTTNDLPILEAVAREDAALVKNWTPHIGRRWPEDDIPRDHYPLREMATNVIATIQKRSGVK